jgi:hypothetical protein
MQQGPVWPGQQQPLGVIHGAINQVRVRNANAIDLLESDPLQPLKIPESRLLFIYFAARGAAGRTDCCSRMAGLRVFSPLRETELWLVSFGKR